MRNIFSQLKPFLMAFMTSVAPISSSTQGVIKTRGAFILFEGVDRSGKSTQAALLVEYFKDKSALVRFPDRTTSIGHLINSYLQSSANLSDQTIHLLFSANRWEASDSLTSKLLSGQSLVGTYR